jgi:hypothetical protein
MNGGQFRGTEQRQRLLADTLQGQVLAICAVENFLPTPVMPRPHIN